VLESTDEEDVKGKVVVITGSNSGIGKEAAAKLAKCGATVVMCNRDRDADKTRKAIIDFIIHLILLYCPSASLVMPSKNPKERFIFFRNPYTWNW